MIDKQLQPWAVVIILSIAVLNASSCSLTSPTSGKVEESKEPLEIIMGGGGWPGFFPIFLAQENGFFAEEGVEIKAISPQEDFTQRILDFENGLYDGAALPLATLIDMKSRADDLRLILATDISTTADAVVARPEIKTIADLNGKRVMSLPGPYGQLFVASMLAKAKLDDTDISWVLYEDDAKALEGLQSGEIDALAAWEPVISQAVANGAHVIFTGADVPGLVVDGIALHEKTILERPNEVAAFVRGWFRAVDFWKANPEDAQKLLAKALQIEPSTISLEGLRLLTLEENRKAFTVGETYESLLHTSQAYSESMIKRGILDKPVNLENFLDPIFINAVK